MMMGDADEVLDAYEAYMESGDDQSEWKKLQKIICKLFEYDIWEARILSSEAFGGRTDLALETQERMKQKKMDLRGVRFEETTI